MTSVDPVSPRWQFSLRGLFILVTLCALFFGLARIFGYEMLAGFYAFPLALALIVAIIYVLSPGEWLLKKMNAAATLLLLTVLYAFIAAVFLVFGEVVDPPRPGGPSLELMMMNLNNHWPLIPMNGMVMALLIGLDGLVQTSRPRDRAWYPRWQGLVSIIARFELRLTLLVGVLLVLGWYATTVVDVFSATRRGGMYWPGPRVFVLCELLWAVFWTAECLSRPRGGTIVAAIIYLNLVCLFLIPLSYLGIRE